MTPLRCSIIVRAFNEEKHIGRLFMGLNQQTSQDFELILVDSGSTDRTKEIAAGDNWDFPVRILQIEPERFSFGRSLNSGIREAGGEIIVMASAHVYPVYPDWLEKLIHAFDDSRVGLSYGKQRGGETTRFSEHQIFARWFPDQSKVQEVNPFCNNANAAIRKILWLEHQYDETLSGLEDLEWAHWAVDQGYSISYVAEAEIIHIHEDTPRGIYNRYKREAMAFKRIFPEQQFSFWNFVRLYLGNAWSDITLAMKERKVGREFGGILWFRFMQFWGTYRGYQQSGPLTEELRQTFYYPGGYKTNQKIPTRNIEPIQYRD